MPSSTAAPSARGALVAAVVAYWFIQSVVPLGRVLLYPLTLLATWVHEMGHGLTALACGGHFDSLDVFANASGLAYTRPNAMWQAGLTAAGGLIAPPLVGAVFLAASVGPRRARALGAGLAVAIAISLCVWVRSLAGWIALPIVAAFLAAFAVWGSARERMIVSQMVGVALAVDTWTRRDYLFSASVLVDGAERPSDISNVARAFGGPYLVWGLALFVLALALLAGGIALAWRSPGSAGPARNPG